MKIPKHPHIILGVTAVIYDTLNQRVLLGKKGRSAFPEYIGKWVAPGGKVNHGEKMIDAVIRETFEETGLQVLPVTLIGHRELIRPDHHYVFFVYQCIAPPDGPEPRAGDDLEYVQWHHKTALGWLRPSMTPMTQSILFPSSSYG